MILYLYNSNPNVFSQKQVISFVLFASDINRSTHCTSRQLIHANARHAESSYNSVDWTKPKNNCANIHHRRGKTNQRAVGHCFRSLESRFHFSRVFTRQIDQVNSGHIPGVGVCGILELESLKRTTSASQNDAFARVISQHAHTHTHIIPSWLVYRVQSNDAKSVVASHWHMQICKLAKTPPIYLRAVTLIRMNL